MSSWTQAFVYTLLGTSTPLSTLAGSVLSTRMVLGPNFDPPTGLIVAQLESKGPVDWTSDLSGGQWADFGADAWEEATNIVIAKQKAEALVKSGNPPELTERAWRRFHQTRASVKGKYLPEGMNVGDYHAKNHSAFFHCYNSGQAAYSNSLATITGLGCSAIFEGGAKVATRVWVSKEFWTPEHRVAKVFLTVIGKGLMALSAIQCGWTTQNLIQQYCQNEEGQTQGGKLYVYENDYDAFTNGKKIATLKIDPNTCSKEIKVPGGRV